MSRLEKSLQQKQKMIKIKRRCRIVFLICGLIIMIGSLIIVDNNVMNMFGEKQKYNLNISKLNLDDVKGNVNKYINQGMKEANKINTYIKNKIKSK